MKLADALKLAKAPQNKQGQSVEFSVACGAEPLHLETFLIAQARAAFPDSKIAIRFGLFGDLFETLYQFSTSPSAPAAVVVEWSDLDQRLGYRASGTSYDDVLDILETVSSQAQRLQKLVLAIADRAKVVYVPPSIPLPVFLQAGDNEVSAVASTLDLLISNLHETLNQHGNIHILNLSCLAMPENSLNLNTLLSAGFPYTIDQTSILSAGIAGLLFPQPSIKGIITDLDNTLWRGILGDDGVEGVHWSLEKGSHNHVLFQQLLATLSAQGILIGVVSKNDPDNVARIFERADMVLKKDSVFPIEASWGRKSTAVGEVLRTWNILPESVLFVDDSPMELEEVHSQFPEIRCLKFPTKDDGKLYGFLSEVKRYCKNREQSIEDGLRLESLRSNKTFTEQVNTSTVGDYDEFLSNCHQTVYYDFSTQRSDGRAYELVNKANQFNLNGKRFSIGEWDALMDAPDSFLMTIAYEDKFGPMGTIAVVIGRRSGNAIRILSWVMSCRAFSRRIEYQTLAIVFDQLGSNSIEFTFEKTPKNDPLCRFLRPLFGSDLVPGITLERAKFESHCPRLHHEIEQL